MALANGTQSLSGFHRTIAREARARRHGRLSRRLSAPIPLMVALAIAVGALACKRVAPYERGTLAHPTMTPEDMGTALDEHVRGVSEGPGGGLGGGGGGCGCN